MLPKGALQKEIIVASQTPIPFLVFSHCFMKGFCLNNFQTSPIYRCLPRIRKDSKCFCFFSQDEEMEDRTESDDAAQNKGGQDVAAAGDSQEDDVDMVSPSQDLE